MRGITPHVAVTAGSRHSSDTHRCGNGVGWLHTRPGTCDTAVLAPLPRQGCSVLHVVLWLVAQTDTWRNPGFCVVLVFLIMVSFIIGRQLRCRAHADGLWSPSGGVRPTLALARLPPRNAPHSHAASRCPAAMTRVAGSGIVGIAAPVVRWGHHSILSSTNAGGQRSEDGAIRCRRHCRPGAFSPPVPHTTPDRDGRLQAHARQ